MTDWARANLVSNNILHRSDRSSPTGQTGLSREDVQPMQVDSGKTTVNDVVKIGDVNVVVKDVGKKPMVFGKSAQTDSQKRVLANDYEASSNGSANKYYHPR